jgi:Phytanoyl-CoA dioxygenase (PhyH)
VDVQPWFEYDDFRTRDCYSRLSPAQREWVEDYRRDGYVVLEDPNIDAATMDSAAAELRGKYTQPATGYSSPGRIQDAWQISPAVRQMATSRTVLEVLSALYQKTPIPFQTLNFQYGTQQRAHSDTIHFNTLPFGFMCGVWIALEDIDLTNGPLFYYPGSQRLPVFHMSDLGLESGAEQYPQYEDRVEQLLAESGIQPKKALLKRGQALIWSSNIFHGGSKILDKTRTRHSQVTHYYFPGCIYYTPLLSDPQNQRWRLRQVRDIRTMEVAPLYDGVTQPSPPRVRKRRKLSLRLPFLKGERD